MNATRWINPRSDLTGSVDDFHAQCRTVTETETGADIIRPIVFFWFSNEKRSSVSKANDAMVSSDLMAVLRLLVVYSVFSLASAGGHWSYKFGNGKKN